MSRHECDRCGVAACDLPDGIDPDLIFDQCDCGDTLCGGCATIHRCDDGIDW